MRAPDRRALLLGALATPFLLRGVARAATAPADAAPSPAGGTASRVPAGTPASQVPAGTTLRAAQYKAGDALLLRLAGQDHPPYRVDWSEFSGGNLMVEAMNAGAIDLAYGSEIPPAFAAASGARIKVIAVIRGDVNEQVVLVPEGSEVKDIAGLRGKRVGYVRGTTTHYYLNRMLRDAGLTFRDIQAVNLSPSDGQAAFRSGALDAWAIYGYSVPLARQAGARQLRNAAGILSGNYLVFAHPDALADPARAAAIADHLGRISRAFLWIDDHHADYAAAQSRALNVPENLIRDLLDHVSQPRRLAVPDDAAVASHQAVADEFATLGLLPAGVQVAPLWDRDFARRLELAA
ncbi:ABC transporter substrate-binding protein [Roseomonas elaeocarpi]|uniref:ABC transporter substrate-binding protein n=1 Tax=Roseomonas elaeocarpi TaxID=907779 RepID=A0ABV6JUY3_9PROT